ncbi:MAG: DEAD/DEAH box helicase [Myxococcales bacterium]|nr:DEAD/DEAH box helicase [Myxococcales bacterium]
MTTYAAWLAERERELAAHSVPRADPLPDRLFDFQRDLVEWALDRGRAALFADTGLGKTLMQCSWAQQVAQHGRVIVLAPLAVATQTVREAAKFGIRAEYCREDTGADIVVTNYEMLKAFDVCKFAGVVLDESSILKAYDGKTRTTIIEAFARTPYRLACTATPAPNDHTELGNHAEFLGVKSRAEMLAEFFVHDGARTSEWRLKGHARDAFWRWVSLWAAMVKRPSDLGYSDEGFALPDLVHEALPIDALVENGQTLFGVEAISLSDQRKLRRETLTERVDAIASAIADEPNEPALVWCELNAESEALTKAIEGAVEVRGNHTREEKESRLLGFTDGKHRVMVSKTSICGFGMNWQHCARVYFVAPSHSYEQTYQAVRRCWRFGQKRPVIVRTCEAWGEQHVTANLQRKRDEAERMGRELVNHIMIKGEHSRWNRYDPRQSMQLPAWMFESKISA